MSQRILIMGLPGAGKTTLAKALQGRINAAWFNADDVRKQFNDWDFGHELVLQIYERNLGLNEY
jgi:predicted kinase